MSALLAAVLVLAALSPGPRPAARGRNPRSMRPERLVTAAHTSGKHGALGNSRLATRLTLRRRHREQHEAVAQALELTARALRSGASVLTALDSASRELPAAELQQVVHGVRAGLSLDAALRRWSGARRERQTAAALLVLGHTSGAAMAASLDRAAASLRERKALEDEVRALTSQTRVSGMVVAAAPAGFATIVVAVDPDALAALVATPVGLLSLATGLMLEALGIWWMARLCRGVMEWA